MPDGNFDERFRIEADHAVRLEKLETQEPIGAEPPGEAGLVTVNWVFFEGGEVLTEGLSGYLRVGFAGKIQDVELIGDAVGDFECDIWIDDYAGSPPVVGDSVCGSAYPDLSSEQKSQDTTLSGWTTEFEAGWWGFNVRGTPATVTQVTIALNVKRLMPAA